MRFGKNQIEFLEEAIERVSDDRHCITLQVSTNKDTMGVLVNVVEFNTNKCDFNGYFPSKKPVERMHDLLDYLMNRRYGTMIVVYDFTNKEKLIEND